MGRFIYLMRIMLLGSALLLLSGCGGGKGGGDDNAQYITTKVVSTLENAEVATLVEKSCGDAGGVALYTGFDTNHNNLLDESEYIGEPEIICNGNDGTSALVKTETLPVGSTECPNGGTRIYYGTDSNGDATLQPSEYTGHTDICNGENAVNGNTAPIAATQSVSTDEDVAKPITLTGTDTDGDTLIYTVTANPAHGTLSGTAPDLIYTPMPNYNGIDSFTFKVNDGTEDSTEATVHITVNSINDMPVANAGNAQFVHPGVLVTLDGNHSFDIDGDTLDYTWTLTRPSGSIAVLHDATTAYPTFTPLKGGVYTARLVVNDGTLDSAVDVVTVSVHENMMLALNEVNTGYEPWFTDGESAHTDLVTDINVNTSGSNVRNTANIGSTLYFAADDNEHGMELWKSDGTEAGTVMVKDIVTGPNDSSPQKLIEVNGTLFFALTQYTTAHQLWKSDGTEVGTVMLKDLDRVDHFTEVNGTLYFSGSDSEHGQELWKSDGTESGTVMVKDIYNGTGGSRPRYFVNMNNLLYFSVDYWEGGVRIQQLWKSDGTEEGTTVVKDIHEIKYLTEVNGTLYFNAKMDDNGSELWKSDGTEAGTVMVKDMVRGSTGSNPTNLTDVNGTLYFSALQRGAYYMESHLWKSDGTEAGTVMIGDFGRYGPGNFININGTLFFSRRDLSYGSREVRLYKSNGEGITLIKTFSIGDVLRFPVKFNDELYFSINTGHGNELWKSNGTEAGTIMIKDINPGSHSSDPSYLIDVNGVLFFGANDGINGYELWRSDGTESGTIMIKNIMAGKTSSSLDGSFGIGRTTFVQIGDTYYFGADDGIHGQELWKSDGTEAGTTMVKDLISGYNGSSPKDLISVNGILFFKIDDGIHGSELWRSDGTEAGTGMVKDICAGFYGSSPYNLIDINGTLFFFAFNSNHESELWKSDGTEAGTVMVRPSLSASDSQDRVINYNGTLFFSGRSSGGNELWKSDGTTMGTVMVKDIHPGTVGSYILSLVEVNGTLYFDADDGSRGSELWKSDGTEAGTMRVKDIRSGNTGSFPQQLIDINGTLYFRANDGIHGVELWKSDGTEAGTHMVKDIVNGSATSNPLQFTEANGMLFFIARDSIHGSELWKSDGTEAGTVMVKDINPGTANANIYLYHSMNGYVIFTAEDSDGIKLWKSDGTEAGTVELVSTGLE